MNTSTSRQKLRERYMELALYPDQYKGTDKERLIELYSIREQIRKLRYKSIKNFINATLEDSSSGILSYDFTKTVLRYLRGYRDKVSWEYIANAHQLTVNGESSPWVSTKIPAEVAGYMAFYKTPHTCRIVRFFDTEKYRVL